MARGYQQKLQSIRRRRVGRIRARVRGTAQRPRLAVFRSLKHISAQIIDDTAGRTIVAVRDSEVSAKLKGVERAAALGALMAERARRHGLERIVLDRRHYKYHGQIKALAEALRAGGLMF